MTMLKKVAAMQKSKIQKPENQDQETKLRFCRELKFYNL